MAYRSIAATALLLGSLVLACGGEQKKAQTPPPAPTSETTTTSAKAPAPETTTPVSPSISVSEEIARACRLHFDDVGRAPKFDFDRSDLLSADYDVLAKIGECLSTGPLAGRAVKLVGRADPRGTVEYNMALGARRAHSVASYLENLGVANDRITETSRGELDAVGTEEGTWQIDRRVDIVLSE